MPNYGFHTAKEQQNLFLKRPGIFSRKFMGDLKCCHKKETTKVTKEYPNFPITNLQVFKRKKKNKWNKGQKKKNPGNRGPRSSGVSHLLVDFGSHSQLPCEERFFFSRMSTQGW